MKNFSGYKSSVKSRNLPISHVLAMVIIKIFPEKLLNSTLDMETGAVKAEFTIQNAKTFKKN